MKKLLISTISNPYFLMVCFICQLSYASGKANGIELGEIRGLRMSSQIMNNAVEEWFEKKKEDKNWQHFRRQ